MTTDASLPQAMSHDASPQRPLWSVLARWWAPAASAADPMLGYESAHPWTLGVDASTEAGEARY